jgi:hypothetical protein
MTYTATGDKELWLIRTEAVDIPVYCTPVEDTEGYRFWIMVAAVFIHKGYHTTLSLKIQDKSIVTETDRWIVPEAVLPEIAQKCPGVTPSYYFKAAGLTPEPHEFTAEENPEAPDHDDEFLREVWHRSQVAKLGVFKVVWTALIDGIAKRLLIDQKPLDLGWFTIHALPYRANWKHNLWAKHPRLHIYFGGVSALQRQTAMKLHGVEADLSRTDMMAVKGANGRVTFRHTLEIQFKKEWWQYMDEVELQRLTSTTPASYLSRWGTMVRKSRKVINAILEQFVEEVARPAGRPVPGHGGSAHRLVQHFPAEGGRAVRVDRDDCPLVLDDRESEVRGPEDYPAKGAKAKKVPALPVLRLQMGNLRNPRGDVGGGGEEGEAGVLVPAGPEDR